MHIFRRRHILFYSLCSFYSFSFGVGYIIIIFLGGKNDTLFLIHWFIAYSIYTVVYDFVLMSLIFS